MPRYHAPGRTCLGGRISVSCCCRTARRTHTLYGPREGRCKGCREWFHFRNTETDHVIARSNGVADYLENLQLLCGACDRVKATGNGVSVEEVGCWGRKVG